MIAESPANQQQRAGSEEGLAIAECVGDESADQRADGRAGVHRDLHQPQNKTKPVLRRGRRDQGSRGGDYSGHTALNEPQQQQLQRSLSESHKADHERAAKHRPDQHRLSAVAIGDRAPDRLCDDHRHGARRRDPARPLRRVSGILCSEHLDVQRNEREDETESDRAGGLSDPDGDHRPDPARRLGQSGIARCARPRLRAPDG